MDSNTLDWIAFGILIGVVQLFIVIAFWAVYKDVKISRLEEEAIERGFAHRLYNKNNYGKFEWKDNNIEFEI
jgi:hypothetical protein